VTTAAPDPSAGEPGGAEGTKASTDQSYRPRSFGKITGFDGLRGVGVLIIFVAHIEVILPIETLLVVPGAAVPLDLFFVLSGFLITALLLREQGRFGKIGTGAFYRRRVLRLLPALYVVVLANALFAYFTHQWAHTETESILSVLFYFSNFFSASAAGPLTPKLASGFQHMWSLAFEEQFYFIWPWVTIALLTIRLRLRTVVIVILILILAVGVHRAILWEEAPRWWSYLYRTDTRADSILWGALLAHIWMRHKEPTRWFPLAGWIAAAFLVFVLIFTNEYGPFLYLGGFDAIDIACGVLLLAILDGRWGGRHLFELKPLVAMGVVSYAFYLWHLPVFFAVRHYDAHWNDVVRVVVAFGATLALTLLSWFVLEKPLMRWSKRLEDKRRTTLEAGTPAGGPAGPTGPSDPSGPTGPSDPSPARPLQTPDGPPRSSAPETASRSPAPETTPTSSNVDAAGPPDP
jgi:peptidoglycan/LPS O-acetylase OafA/YrhL